MTSGSGHAGAGGSDRPVRVLQVLATAEPGGVERNISRLLPRLRQRGIGSDVLLLRAGGPIEEALRRERIDVYSLPGIGPLKNGNAFARLLRARGYEVLHAYGARAALLTRHAAARCGRQRPHVVTAITGVRRGRDVLRQAADRITRRWNDLYVADCEASARAAIAKTGIPVERVQVVHPGIEMAGDGAVRSRAETRGSLGLGQADPVLICVANLRPMKGHRHLLQAFGKILAEFPGARLLLVGADRMGGTLQAEVRNCLPHGSVRFLGVREDVRDLLRASDIFVLASEAEGLCVANLEAMRAGLPVVVTAVGGLPEAVRPGLDGYLVPPRDPESFARAVRQLLNDRSRAEQMGLRARERVLSCFSIERTADRMASLYSRLVRGSGGGISRADPA